ncbi:hypothetical protein GOP47_0028186 [Adiantum capillus-veneris]|nr:hypothetical protein GOP47_0028186 [Adiantum capillus-veneris]
MEKIFEQAVVVKMDRNRPSRFLTRGFKGLGRGLSSSASVETRSPLLLSNHVARGLRTLGTRWRLGSQNRNPNQNLRDGSWQAAACSFASLLQVERAARKMAASPLIADSPVPDWVRRNSEIFRNPPRGADRSNRPRNLERTLVEQKLVSMAAVQGAARARAELSEDDGQGSIDPPAFLPPASYYQDVRNHPNIASTMLVTARRQVGFEPSLAGEEVSAQQMDEFVTKFYKWVIELDNYWPYLDIKGSQAMALWFHLGNENLINQDVSKFLTSFWGLGGEVVETWRESLTGMVKGASTYVTQHGGNVRTVSFQMDILDTSGKSNPIQPLTFGRTVQSDPPLGKYDSVLTSGITYLVDSNAIIAAADDFAQNGVSIFGAKEYCAYVNNAR